MGGCSLPGYRMFQRQENSNDHERESPSSEVAQFGFRWGQVDVIRAYDINGAKGIFVSTDSRRLEVYVSKGGRSLRVFRDGIELVEKDTEGEQS